ncbi:hypothetical protein EDB89DRAFT_1904249 [Lactarius sanguifluus]|nr:hypothetical protein EDB89DRAFT_1904249 [Lactarius sanguifluus]
MLRWCSVGGLTISGSGGAVMMWHAWCRVAVVLGRRFDNCARWWSGVVGGNCGARQCCWHHGGREGLHDMRRVGVATGLVGLANHVGGAIVVGLACCDVAPGAFMRQGTGGRGCGWRETGATSDAWRNGGAGAAVTWSVTPMRNDKEKKKKTYQRPRSCVSRRHGIRGRGSPEFAWRGGGGGSGGGEHAWGKIWRWGDVWQGGGSDVAL